MRPTIVKTTKRAKKVGRIARPGALVVLGLLLVESAGPTACSSGSRAFGTGNSPGGESGRNNSPGGESGQTADASDVMDASMGGATGGQLHGESGADTATGGLPEEPGCQADADCESPLPAVQPAGCALAACDAATAQCVFKARDEDGDGFRSHHCQALDDAVVEAGPDCDDRNAAVHPEVQAETCNALDDDCDGEVDEEIGPDLTVSCVRPVGAIAVNMCRETGYAVCVNGRWDGCTVEGRLPLFKDDTPACDDKDYNCNNALLDKCPCKSGDRGNCTTSDFECPGQRTCTVGSWGTCTANNPSACECKNGAQKECEDGNRCAGKRTCGGNQWGICKLNDPTCSCLSGSQRACAGSECPAIQSCDSSGHWLACGKAKTCDPTFGCGDQSQFGDASAAHSVQCDGGGQPGGQLGGGQYYAGQLPAGGSVGGTVRAEYVDGGCYDTAGETAININCYAALPGCAEPPEGWGAASLAGPTFQQAEVTGGHGLRSATKGLPSTSIPGRTVCCDTYSGAAGWTPWLQGCCKRRVVFDWVATAPPKQCR